MTKRDKFAWLVILSGIVTVGMEKLLPMILMTIVTLTLALVFYIREEKG